MKYSQREKGCFSGQKLIVLLIPFRFFFHQLSFTLVFVFVFSFYSDVYLLRFASPNTHSLNSSIHLSTTQLKTRYADCSRRPLPLHSSNPIIAQLIPRGWEPSFCHCSENFDPQVTIFILPADLGHIPNHPHSTFPNFQQEHEICQGFVPDYDKAPTYSSFESPTDLFSPFFSVLS